MSADEPAARAEPAGIKRRSTPTPPVWSTTFDVAETDRSPPDRPRHSVRRYLFDRSADPSPPGDSRCGQEPMLYGDGRRDYRTRSPDTRRAGVRCLCDRFAWPLLATTGVGEGLAAGRTVDAGPAPAALRHTQLLRMTGGESDRHRPRSIACQSRLTVRSSPMSHLRSIRHGPLQVAVLRLADSTHDNPDGDTR